jgi:hypothetical protein
VGEKYGGDSMCANSGDGGTITGVKKSGGKR